MSQASIKLLYVALLWLSAIPSIHAHVALLWPIPYGGEALRQNREPMSGASAYPCRKDVVTGWTATAEQKESNVIKTNQEYQLSFFNNTDKSKDAAVHNGGSCQLSITLDEQPSAKSVFKTFYSIIGGCPGIGGLGDVRHQPFMLPGSIPKGNLIFAWTWFPAHSGTQEMYMNCAPVTVTDGADDTTEFDKLPDMLVANIQTSAEVTRGDDQRKYLDDGVIPPCYFDTDAIVHFPAPGYLFSTAVDTVTASANEWSTSISKIATACGTSGSTTSVTVAGQLPGVTAASNEATPTPSAASGGGAGGGGFIEASASRGSATTLATTTTAAAAAQTESSSTPDNSLTAVTPTTTSPTPIGSVDTPVAATPTGGTADKACSSVEDGQLVCNGTDQFGICNWGKVVWVAVADGTVCENGTIKAAKTARAAAEAKVAGDRRSGHLHFHGRYSAGRRYIHG